MKNFKVEVSRGLEKYVLIRKAETETGLKEELHKEGFTLLSIQGIENIEVSGNKFYFEILENNGTIKIGTIVSNDIFKAYLKIKYELKYNLKSLYIHPNTSQEEKEKIIKELEGHYQLYLQANQKEIQKKQQQQEIKLKNVVEESIDTFAMKKELDQVYKIIDKVLVKLKYFLEIGETQYISFEKRETLKSIFNEIIKLKNSTNIPKLRQIGELALQKVGELELQILEAKKDEESKLLLRETNKLLREVGSKTTFIEKEKDLGYIISNLFKKVQENIENTKKPTKKVEIDTTSLSFLKNKSLFNKYNSKLKQLQKEMIQNFFVFCIPTESNIEKRDYFQLKKKVIEQNITILQSRITGKSFSYVKLVKGYHYFIDKMIDFITFFNQSILIIIVFYSFVFLLLHTLTVGNIISAQIDFNGLFYFIYFNILFLLLKYTKGFLSLFFNIVILSFLFIFGVINF